ncbi:unnamed protein product [Miscanthus lutarioriparius]|uniref:Sirohydrochlorin ferrochelatase n=1 Tax=Miscanthus lutarioriparius TaxID=422564 RepID=A0A811RI96_9POAL|nr:unnamed protein product [Miscanthus lutarioriparius]
MEHLGANQTGPKKLLQNTAYAQTNTYHVANIYQETIQELAEPTIKDAFGKCVQQGASRVVVSPYFLSPGRHWKQDIPALAAEASKEHSNIPYIVTAPLGLHELMVDIMNDRIKYCLRHVAGDVDECTVCAGTGKCRLYS